MQPSKPKPQEITYHKCTHAHTHKHIRLSVCLAVCLSVCLRLWTYVACIFRRYCVGLFCPLKNNNSSLFLLMCVSVCVWPPVIVIVYVNLGIFSPILYASVAVTASNKLCTKHFRLKCKNNWKATGITFKYQQTTHTHRHACAIAQLRAFHVCVCVWSSHKRENYAYSPTANSGGHSTCKGCLPSVFEETNKLHLFIYVFLLFYHIFPLCIHLTFKIVEFASCAYSAFCVSVKPDESFGKANNNN